MSTRQTEPATKDNFDENAYLLANADIARAVLAGEVASGWAHFQEFGEREGRQQISLGSEPFTFYEARSPAAQNALDLFKGRWSSHIPGYGYGSNFTFAAPAINWFAQQCSGVNQKSILELGPLEGGNTFMLASMGARVTAIEANSGSFLRCLIAKEVLGYEAKFLLGDFVSYLTATDQGFDAIVASGVLYHMVAPVSLLLHLMRLTDMILLWTHYFDPDVIGSKGPDIRRKFANAPQVNEQGIELWRYEYLDSREHGVFCGGPASYSNWLTKVGLFKVLNGGGFEIAVGEDQQDHPNGPAILLTARHRRAS